MPELLQEDNATESLNQLDQAVKEATEGAKKEVAEFVSAQQKLIDARYAEHRDRALPIILRFVVHLIPIWSKVAKEIWQRVSEDARPPRHRA